MLYARNLAPVIETALGDTPVVLLHGARQTGKSTLVQSLVAGGHPGRYVTLDDAAVLAAASASPEDFLAGLADDVLTPGASAPAALDAGGREKVHFPVILDEVQRVPGLFLAIKAAVDRDRRPGRFLLTGSADLEFVPETTHLAGRAERLELWPLSQGELVGLREGFLELAFADDEPTFRVEGVPDRAMIVPMLLRGGFPEAVRRDEDRRRAWYGSYLTILLQRDIRDFSAIEGLAELPRLLKLLAARSGSLLNFAELSRSSGIAQTTLKRYISLLEKTFLVQMLPAWTANLSKRLTRSPKILLCDSGLLAYLRGADAPGMLDRSGIGTLLETFVAMEIRKQVAWSRVKPELYHFRTHAGQEVDLVLEDRAGRIVAIEVKANSSVNARDFAHLKFLADATGDRFLRGIVLYTGTQPLRFGPNLHALPWDALWRAGSSPGRPASP